MSGVLIPMDTTSRDVGTIRKMLEGLHVVGSTFDHAVRQMQPTEPRSDSMDRSCRRMVRLALLVALKHVPLAIPWDSAETESFVPRILYGSENHCFCGRVHGTIHYMPTAILKDRQVGTGGSLAAAPSLEGGPAPSSGRASSDSQGDPATSCIIGCFPCFGGTPDLPAGDHDHPTPRKSPAASAGAPQGPSSDSSFPATGGTEIDP